MKGIFSFWTCFEQSSSDFGVVFERLGAMFWRIRADLYLFRNRTKHKKREIGFLEAQKIWFKKFDGILLNKRQM